MRVPLRRNPLVKILLVWQREASSRASKVDVAEGPRCASVSRWNEVVAELAADPRPFEELSFEERRARVSKLRGSLRAKGSPSEDFLRRKQEEIELEEAKLARAAG